MKKLLALVLALCLMTGVVSALAEGFTLADSYEVGERVFDGGEITTTKAAGGSGTPLTTDVYMGNGDKDYTDEKMYTYNESVAELTSSTCWDPLAWETQSDREILDYITSGFYTFVLNSDMSGYSLALELASDVAQDVTAEYVGKFGVAEGETGKAWRIPLKKDITWDDGTAITAADFEYSIKELLNPKTKNRRADSYYAGDFVVYNAKNYLYAGETAYDLITDTAEALIAAGTDVYLDMDFWGMTGAVDAEENTCPKYVNITNDVMYRDAGIEDETADEAWVSAKYIFDNYLAEGKQYNGYAAQYLYTASIAPETSWDDVGFKVIDDYTIDFILAKPIEEASFYIPYNLSSSYLVKKDLYESCKKFWDADGKEVDNEEAAATITTTYGKTLETTASYGPYKLTSFELDKEYTLSRNDEWYGYRDGAHKGQYQTDVIKRNVIKEHKTDVLSFEKGEIDHLGLQSEDLEKYGTSKYVKYGPNNGYTTKLSFNTNYEKLKERGTNSQVLVIDEFRQAFAYCYDRKEFATAYTAAGTAGFGLINELYCYNPFTGAYYRQNDYAKAGLLKVFDVAYGEGTDYATLDEAYEAMTGYDMPKAQALMKVAYDKAVEAKVYDGESPIEIEFRVYQSDEIYVKMFTYLNEHLQEACKGSGFEGKVSLKMTVDADYYETNYSGGADMIFTTWGGATMSPFTILYECYCDASDGSGQQMEYGYDTSKIIVKFVVDGNPIEDTLQHWARWADGGDADTGTTAAIEAAIGNFTDYDYDTRCAFYAQLEAAFLNWYPTTAVYYRNTATMDSQKIHSASDTYVTLMEFGGIQFMTFNYDDAEWADYIANNELVY